MAMKHFEDMDSLDIESMVSVMLEEDRNIPVVQHQMPKLGDAEHKDQLLGMTKAQLIGESK